VGGGLVGLWAVTVFSGGVMQSGWDISRLFIAFYRTELNEEESMMKPWKQEQSYTEERRGYRNRK